MSNAQKLRNKVNRELRQFNSYFESIPLSAIFKVVEQNIGTVVQEDGTPWSGFLLGEDSNTSFQIAGFKYGFLRLSWHKMPSGRYEVGVYVS